MKRILVLLAFGAVWISSFGFYTEKIMLTRGVKDDVSYTNKQVEIRLLEIPSIYEVRDF